MGIGVQPFLHWESGILFILFIFLWGLLTEIRTKVRKREWNRTIKKLCLIISKA